MKILVDADALVALAKDDDTNHNRAVKIAKALKRETLYVTPLTIPEAATVLSYRVSQKSAQQFLKETRQRRLIELPLMTQASLLADEIFLKQNKKGISWIDCLNVAMIKIHNLDGIFSFDSFYQKFGLLTSIK
jgi:predicted nucleic acid-binding protein